MDDRKHEKRKYIIVVNRLQPYNSGYLTYIDNKYSVFDYSIYKDEVITFKSLFAARETVKLLNIHSKFFAASFSIELL